MPQDIILITIGCLMIAGLAVDGLGSKTRLPRVTLLVLLGIAIGPSGFDLLPSIVEDWYPLVATMALVMVAFLLGGTLTRKTLRESGRHILAVSMASVVATAGLVGFGLWAVGVDPVLCFVMAGISTATAPAATQDVVRRSGAETAFSRLLLGVVAVDDAWGLIAFSLLLSAGQAFIGHEPTAALITAVHDLGGALLIGVIIGVPAAYLTGRLQPGEPSLTESLGVVFLCGGLSLAFEVSFLLAGMIAGLIVANFARHHRRAFHEIEAIEWPFKVMFFILAGASLSVETLPAIGLLGVAYTVLRIMGRLIGGWIGGAMSGLPRDQRNWIGIALMPQAGVALGMALVAATAFPTYRDQILAAAIGSTILFELAGPIMTQWALVRVDRGTR